MTQFRPSLILTFDSGVLWGAGTHGHLMAAMSAKQAQIIIPPPSPDYIYYVPIYETLELTGGVFSFYFDCNDCIDNKCSMKSTI